MSAVASSSSGRVPQGEVIMDFGDGGQYIKHKMEHAVLDLEKRRVMREEGLKAQKAMEALDVSKPAEPSVKSEDVEFIVAQMGCSKEDAEVALKEERGDLVKALIKLVKPRPRARSELVVRRLSGECNPGANTNDPVEKPVVAYRNGEKVKA